MGRSSSANLAFLALLGASGCLLFTDPINKAPEVDIVSPGVSILRGDEVELTANIRDDKDPLSTLDIEWAVFESDKNGSCVGITKNDWAEPAVEKTPRASDQPYRFTATSEKVVCVCVQATDRNGAKGQDCERIVPGPATLVATITDVSGVASGQPRPLCSQIHLSAESSRYPKGDQVEFHWSIEYPGTDPLGRATQLVDCDGIDKSGANKCFNPAAPGIYTVTMSFTDKPAGSTTQGVQSKADKFTVLVGADTPPYLQQTDPDVHALLIMLSRSTDLGVTNPSRTFQVLSVADDCEPYPAPKQSAQFVWSVLDGSWASPKWVYQANTTNSFTVSQAMFPSALPGDFIKVRVEVRDVAVHKSVMSGASACPLSETNPLSELDICCGPGDCAGNDNDRIRWTTWTVQFLP